MKTRCPPPFSYLGIQFLNAELVTNTSKLYIALENTVKNVVQTKTVPTVLDQNSVEEISQSAAFLFFSIAGLTGDTFPSTV